MYTVSYCGSEGWKYLVIRLVLPKKVGHLQSYLFLFVFLIVAGAFLLRLGFGDVLILDLQLCTNSTIYIYDV